MIRGRDPEAEIAENARARPFPRRTERRALAHRSVWFSPIHGRVRKPS